MRRILLWIAPVLLLALAVAVPRITSAENPAAEVQRTLDVTGRGTISVRPDTAVISLGATALEETPTAAYNAIGKVMTEVTAVLTGLGIEEADIKTQGLNLGAEYNWIQDRGQVLNGYRAGTTIVITTQDLDRVAEYIEAAVDAGANQLMGISFTVKNTQAVVEQAMDAAVDDAMAKAERVATRMGTAVLSVLRVSVMDSGNTPVKAMDMSYARAEMAAGPAIPVFGGTNEISVMISATFELK